MITKQHSAHHIAISTFPGGSPVDQQWVNGKHRVLTNKTCENSYSIPSIHGIYLVYPGWWFFATPLKNDGVKVSWDDGIPNMMGKKFIHVPNHQPAIKSHKTTINW